MNVLFLFATIMMLLGCSSTHHSISPKTQLKNDSILAQGDSVVYAYLPRNMESFPTYEAYHQEPVCVDMIGEIRFNLERIDVHSREIEGSKFDEAKRMCALLDGPGKAGEMAEFAKSISDTKPVLVLYDEGISREQPAMMKVMDGLYNAFIAPLAFMNSFGRGYPRPFSSFTRESAIITSRYGISIFRNGEKRVQHESKLVRRGQPKTMASFGKEEFTHVHLRRYFDEYR